jgi:hypothetical protein
VVGMLKYSFMEMDLFRPEATVITDVESNKQILNDFWFLYMQSRTLRL